MVVNLGADLHLRSAPEPLLAPPAGTSVGDPVVERGSGIRRRGHGASGHRGRLAHSRSGDVVSGCASRMSLPFRRLPCPSADPAALLRAREWLVTNGLGGYASGTISGIVTRRYHGLLVSALPAPIGRMVMLSARRCADASAVGPTLLALRPRACRRDGRAARTAACQPARGRMSLVEFRLEVGLPVWRYEGEGLVIEKRVLMPYRQNTVHLTYRLHRGRGGGAARAAAVHARPPLREPAQRRAAEPVHADGGGRAGSRSFRGPICRRCVCCMYGGRVGAHPRRVADAHRLSRRTVPRIRASRVRCGAPATSTSISASTRPVPDGHARGVDRIVGNGRGADAGSGDPRPR